MVSAYVVHFKDCILICEKVRAKRLYLQHILSVQDRKKLLATLLLSNDDSSQVRDSFLLSSSTTFIYLNTLHHLGTAAFGPRNMK